MSGPALKESSPDFRVGDFLSISPFFVHMAISQPPAAYSLSSMNHDVGDFVVNLS